MKKWLALCLSLGISCLFGDEPSDQILIVGIDSKICDLEGNQLSLPWR